MEIDAISIMFNWAVEHEMIGKNPIAKIKPLPVEEEDLRKVRRSLSVEEVEALFEYSPPHLRPIWVVFMTTGIRKMELVDLRFSDIDFDEKTMHIRGSVAKNHKARTIPLSEEVLEMIAELKAAAPDRHPVSAATPLRTRQQLRRFSRDHVFVTPVNTPWVCNLLREFYRVCRAAGIEGAHPNGSVDLHALRVSFITLSLEHGASAKAVQAIAGHATLAMTTDVYAKTSERSKRAAVGVLPFATTKAPEHILSAHRARASAPEGPEDPTKKTTASPPKTPRIIA
jgi:integrase